MSRTGSNSLGHNRRTTRKNSSYDNNSTDNHEAGPSNTSSNNNNNHHSNSNSTTSNRIAKVGKAVLSRLGSYTSSKTSSSGSLGVKSSGRVKKRIYDSKGPHAPQEVQITMEKSTSYAREFSGTLPDSELELEKVFKGNPNVWGFLESMDTTIVQSKLLKRSPVSPTKTVKSTNMDRYAYLIGSGPTCDISKKGVWLNNVRMETTEVQLKNDTIISFKESDETEPYLSLKIRLPTYFQLLRNDDNFGIHGFYRMKKPIGSGSFGEVYAAECTTTGKPIALKMIPQSKYAGKPRTLQSLLQEIAVYTSLQHHPCIVRMERVMEVNGVFYIAMELGKDGDLFDHVCAIPNPLAEDEVRIIFDQIFHAVDSTNPYCLLNFFFIFSLFLLLQYIHDQDIAHRDLKLENIILMNKQNLQVKIADFGLATFYRGKPFHTMCGTQSYAAPELVLESKCSYDKAVDIWSLGVMLFVTLAKTPPFYDPSSPQPATPEQHNAMLNRIKNGDYNFKGAEKWKKISEQAKDLIQKMLVVDPNERYTIKQILQHPWLQEVE
ncbi:hypothetical protein INT45_003488, partial [Circinella minor]